MKSEKAGSKKHEHFYAELVQRYDGSIELIRADETFIMLNSVCKSNSLLFDEKEYDNYSYYLQSYKGHTYELRNIKAFPGFENLLWEENITIDFPRLIAEGRLMTNLSESDSVPDCGAGLFTVVQENGLYKLRDFSKGIFKQYPALVSSENIEEKVISDDVVRDRLDDCIRSGSFRSGIGLIGIGYYTELYPFESVDGKKGATVLLKKENAFIGMNSNTMLGLPVYMKDNHIIACGKISVTEAGIMFSDINTLMLKFLSENRLSKSFIVQTDIFRVCIEHGISSVGLVCYNNGSEKYNYILGACPAETMSAVRYISVFAISAGLEEMSVGLLSKLTPREGNILRLSAEGNTLKEISVMLNISESTVKTILHSSYKKINVKNKTEAILRMYGLL